MKTSYFANLRNIKVPLSISRFPPKWYGGPRLELLAPPEELLKRANILTDSEYETEYRLKVLIHLSPQEVYEAIIDEYGDDVTLLCFEKPGDFCHRRIVAEWFQSSLNVEVPEWQKAPDFRLTMKF